MDLRRGMMVGINLSRQENNMTACSLRFIIIQNKLQLGLVSRIRDLFLTRSWAQTERQLRFLVCDV